MPKEQLKMMQKKIAKLDAKGINNLQKNPKEADKMKDVQIELGLFEKGINTVIDGVAWKKGISTPITNEDGTVTLVKIHNVNGPMPKKLEEARGYIIADYQSELEKQWIAELRRQYPVSVNEAVLQSIYRN